LDQNWKYDTSNSPSAPVVEMELLGSRLQVLLDTGFGGGVMIPFPLFHSLGLMSGLVADGFTVVMPDARKLPIFTAREIVGIGPFRFAAHVHSSPALNRSLMGREALAGFLTVLDGPRESLTLRSKG
jgi:predicted aspartyl protease